MTAKTANTRKPDLDVILPSSTELEVQGVKCTVKRLKAREFFQLIGIVTSTLGANAGDIIARMEEKKDDEDFTAELIGMMLVAVPLAMEPLIRLIRDIVEPVDPNERAALQEFLWNPEVEDVLAVVDAVLENEQGNLATLLGKGRAYLKKWSSMMTDARGPKSST